MFTFYDDELHNLILVADRSIKEIISFTSVYDYHPPVQYILNKIFLELFGLNEFWLALPSIIFTVTAATICSRLVYKITNSVYWSAAIGIIMILHPLVFLWGKSIRWYPFWNFLTILSIYLFISLWNSERIRKNNAKIIVLAVIVAVSLYTIYHTLIVIASIILTALLLDKKERTWIHTKQTLIVISLALLFFLPHITIFISHTEGFFFRKGIYEEFTGTSTLFTTGYFIYSILFGQSSFPWNVSFIVLFVIGLTAFIGGIIFYFKLKKGISNGMTITSKGVQPFLNIQVFQPVVYITGFLFVLFLIYSSIAGINTSRGLLILPFLLIILFSSVKYFLYRHNKLNPETKKAFYLFSIFTASILILWLIGSYNVLTKQHLHKNGLAIPLSEIIRVIDNSKTDSESELSVITTDFILTYYLMKDPDLKVLSPYTNELSKLFKRKIPSDISESDNIIFIKSYPGSLMPLQRELNNYTAYLFKAGKAAADFVKLGYDPDYMMKIKFFPSSGIEEWRYKIYILKPINQWDVVYLTKIKSLKVH